MQSYEQTFAKRESGPQNSMVLSTDNEYLRQFRGRR